MQITSSDRPLNGSDANKLVGFWSEFGYTWKEWTYKRGGKSFYHVFFEKQIVASNNQINLNLQQ